MPVTARDILADADAFRRAYPHWPHAEPEREPDSEDQVEPEADREAGQ
jgi:hypothetical protein